ncbi:AfsR/SARP family transcriptional regulator [Actinocrispum wychmicini]|uniref:DNA-binding SARP family transcriptional activator n=1 Tax=Actinocrispum wychmicini TaxID=1213861 RepID=A0A4R2JC84_9PSEU|nr:BTAD domain-containing putative transcriptional regulator [Actinocrispum wychmicini]TCO56037.1 DNA-binding SARP family transcriptional activator [Actinocrispum wychmicini]
MEFEVLGPVAVRLDAQQATLGGRLQRVLLGVLLSCANRSVSVDALTDALWDGRPDPRATQKLQLHVHKLRRMLDDPGRLSFGPGGYRLRVLPGELDAERFECLVSEAIGVATQDPGRCADLIRKALGMWRADPYDGLDVPILAGEVRRLTERRLTAVEELYQAELARGQHAAVVPELTDLVGEHPMRERLHALLMIALYQGGRRAEALAVYRNARATMIGELGLEPGPELRAVEQRILAGEPVTFGGAAPEQRAPAQLPHHVRDFVGRDAELSELDDLVLAGSAPIVAVAGTAGVGKTTLVVRWAHRMRERFPDGQLYVDLRGYGPQRPGTPDEALAGFLRALGVPGTGIPPDLAERAARFRTLVAGKRMLLVLDNAHTVDQVRPLLPGTPSCLVLVTSRDSLAGLVAREGARRIDLGRLAAAEGFALLRAVIGERVDADPEATAVLVDRCARLPLALRVAAELIRARRGRGVADLVAELADEQGRLDLFDAGGDQQTAVRAVFSWSYRHLPPDAALLFRLFALGPGQDTEPDALAVMGAKGLRETRRSLDVLLRAHLVEEVSGGRYQLHDLLRVYATELAESTDPKTGRDAALTRLLDWYLYTAGRAMDLVSPHESGRPQVSAPAAATPEFSSYDNALRWLDAERVNLLMAANLGRSDYTSRISPILWRYLDNAGYNDDALTLHTLALAVAEQQGDPDAQGVALRRLGITHMRLWQNDSATRCFERALVLHESAGNRAPLVAVLNNLGLMHAISSGFRDAVRHYEQALDIQRELGDYTFSAAILSNLGDVHRELGDYGQAARCLDQALAITQETADRMAEAVTLCHLAGLAEDLGRYDEALDYLRQALAAATALGSHLVEGDARYQLGTVSRRLGADDRAVEYLNEALKSAEVTGNRRLTARVFNGLAEIRRSNGSPAEAVRHHTDALAIALATGSRYEQARAEAGLGYACHDLGRAAEARDHWQRALAIFTDLGVPAATAVAAALGK